MKNNLTLFAREGKAKSLQNTGGGASQQSTAQHDSARVFNYFNTQMARFLWNKKGEATVSKSSCSWAQGRATSAEQPTNHALITHLSPTQTVSLARIWKYVACLLLVLFVGVGNVWGDVTYDLTGYSTQITNGWTHDYGDIYVGRKGSNYTPVEGGLPTGNSNIFAAFQVTESSSIRVVFVWTKTNGDLSDKQIDLASINKATYDKLALASTGTGNDVKYSIDNFSSSQHSAVAINRSDANKDINIDFETTVSAGYYAVYTASSINASALIKKIIVTPAAASCEDAPTVSSITKGATTATTQVMNCAGISSLGSEGCTISSYGFVYGTSANPTISDTKVQVGTTYTTTGTAFATTTLTGLTPSTTYYVRAYATNGAGTAYSSGDSFTTPASIGNVVYIAGSADASNDAIKALRDANYVVTVRTKAGSPDYTGVDLVVLDESLTWANSDEGGSVIAADVPILNLKAFFYTLSSRWNWGTPVNPSPKSELATLSTEYSNVSSHPIFDGVTISEGAVDMIGTAKDGNNLQGVTTSTLLSGKEGYTLATSASGTTCIHELTPVQRGVTNSKYLLIALSNNIKDNYSADAKKMIVNAAAYLIDNSEQWEPVAPSCAATAEAGADKSTTVGEGVAMAATAATSGYTGAWSIKDGSPSTDAGQLGTTSSNTMTFTPNNTGTYTLVWTVTDDNDNTCYATSEATVTVTAPTHSVSAITSTGNNTYGSVSAASATVAEGSTVLITAVPATGYRVANWAVSGTGATIDPSGSSNSNTTTLTMGTANATVTVTFEEKPCPTSGTLFSLSSVGSGYSNNSDAETELTDITISGGSAYGYGTSERALSYNSNKIKYAGSANYIKLVLDCPLQAGDVISVTCDANTGLNFNSSGTSAAGNESYATGALNGSAYTVVADDGLEGAYSIYCWRRTGNGTNVTAITITRPLKYAVTYSSEKGVAPSNASAASVTLAEITGVSGWKNTGWKANVATEVGGESVDANTLIANGSVVTLSGATTFTAQWAQLYAITTGSPANGTVAADKSNAVAGETITLTATPAGGYKLSAWDVYKTGEATTKVSVTNNQFTMPAYGVTISAEFVESVVLYDYSVMAEAGNKSFTDETVGENGESGKSKTFGSKGNPQLIIEDAGWDSKGNIINSFIKFFGGTSSMSVVIPTGRKATVTIKYGSYKASSKYLQVNGVDQAKPVADMSDGMTTETFGNYMRTVELTNQTGTLTLTANASGNNLYIAYVDVTLTGYASYGITYHLNDGAWNGDAGAATYTYGTGIATLATNVTKTGFDFAGWYGNEGLTGDAVTSIANNVTGAKELWAKWTPKSYTLTWDWNGGSCSATAGDDYTADGSVAFGTELVYPEAATMTKENTAFAGWSTDAATMPAEALTITAQWAPSHAITYTETKGAANSNPTAYIEGTGVASFEPLADVANFHFTGWSPSSISAEATTDQTIVAQWVAAYNVSFNAGEGGGTVPATFQKWATASFELPGQGTMVAPEGKIFDGWKVNGAGENRAAGYEYTMTAAAVEFVAQWKAVTLLINYDGENYSLNTTDFHTGVTLQDEIVASGYPTNAKFGNTCSAVTSIDNLNKAIIYHTKTNVTKVIISAYNNYTGGSTGNLYYSVVAEGATSASVTTKSMTKGSATTDYEVNMTGRSTLYIMCGHDIRICQVSVEENGTANKVAPEVGYSINLNKQRPLLLSGVATSFEGGEYKVASNFKPVNSQVQIKECGTDYYSFTIPAGQTRQLQLTTSNTNKYVVSKTLGDDTEAKKISGNQNINLTAGTWYINPQGSNVNITSIAFAATPDPITITFNSNGGSAVDDQALFAGDKVSVPTAPTKDGYRFVGWQLSGADYDFATTLVAGDAPGFTLDAVWQKVWTVTFNSDGGSDVDEQIVDDGGVATLPDPAPTKAGHSLVRWYKVTGEEGQEETAYNFSTAVTADMTLKVLWHELQDDPSLSALSYDGHNIDLNSGVDNEGVWTFTYELPYNVNYTAGKLVPVAAAGTATVSSITYTSGTKTASFTVTTADGPVVQNYAVVFTNAPKDMLCLVWADMTGDGELTLNATKSALDIDVSASGNVYSADAGYGGYIGYKFSKSGAYMELKNGNFKTGDRVDVFVTTTVGAVIPVFKANDGMSANLVAVSAANMVQGLNSVYLTADATSLYLCRKGDYDGWNPFIAYVAVYRAFPTPEISSISFNGAEGTIVGSTISATIPYSTNLASLPIEATFVSNDPENTSGTVTSNEGTWIEGDNTYVVTDKDGDTKTYTVTLTRAAVSHDASLTELEVEGYSISFDPEVLSYSIELPYGSVIGDLPDITYTVAVGATAVKTDAAVLPGNTVIEVTAEDESTIQEYIVRFTVNRTPRIVIYEGVNADAFVTESSSESVTWTSVGSGSIQNSGCTLNGKTYTNNVKIFGGATSSTRYVEFVIPDNYFAKIYLAASSNSDDEVTIYVTKDELSTKDNALVSVVGDRNNPDWGETDYVFPGHYFLNATNSTRLYELSVQLYPIDYTRSVTQGYYGTICLPNGGIMVGATLFELAYFDATQQKIFFDEILNGVMVAGTPYIFLPKEGASQLGVYYTDAANALAGHANGLYGSYTEAPLAADGSNYILYNNKYYLVDSENVWVGANRAYIKLGEAETVTSPAHAPKPKAGCRRISMGAYGEEEATGIGNLQGDQVQNAKVMIDGQLFIICGDKMYDATGKQVK